MKQRSWFCAAAGAALLASLAVPLAQGAPIPKLYNTGVDDDGVLLGPNVVDPHYTLIESPDEGFPGPSVYTLTDAWPVAPAGPWIAKGPNSGWIAPQGNQSSGNAPGNYTYRTTFDLTGFDPSKAKIVGKWTSDNTGVDIILNDTYLGISQPGNFGALSDFTIEFGFVAGINTLDFLVFNAGDAVNPTGLRVEMIGTVEVAGEAPRIVTQPVGGTYLTGEDVTLTVAADGTPPLSYQWRRNGASVAGATEPTLQLLGVTTAQDGDYTVLVTNASGNVTSTAVKVNVLERLTGLFNTGVDDDGFLIFDGFNDPHYRLVANPDDPAVTEPIVQDSTLFPIVGGPWIANSATSVWIGPRFETSEAAGGDYDYEIEVNLTGFDPTTAFIAGSWATDNTAVLLLNGAPTGVQNAGDFGNLSSFRVESGFLSGVNKLVFRVNNASLGYTGLRVDNLRGGAKRGTVTNDPRMVTQPVGGLVLAGDSFTLTAVADGTAPLAYQWRRNGEPLAGKTEPSLAFASVVRGDAGDYTLVVSNARGSVTSAVATLQVLDRVPGLFNTGVDAAGVVLEDGATDPHYKLTVNPDDPTVTVPIVQDSTVFPIVAGPWVANTDKSKWIGPRFETSGAAGGAGSAGDYTYELLFDLTGFDPATAVLMGAWGTDNLGMDLKLNGTSTGLANNNQFSTLTSFTVSTGFQAGVNKLEFTINNSDVGYTGLRVDNLRLGALPMSSTPPTLAIQASGNNVVLSWPAADTGFTLKSAKALPAGPWTDVNAPVTVVGGSNTVTVPKLEAAEFFRLQK